jgi:3-oxoadipyl-CoA thiolase
MTAAFICDGIRTPFGRYGGALAMVRSDDMAAHVLSALLARHPQLDPGAIDQVVLGCANQAGEDNRNVARMASLLAGVPDSVPGLTVNRLCASGLDAVAFAASAIVSGQADLLLAGGVESMTRAPFVMGKAESGFSRNAKIEDTTMGWRFVNPAMRRAHGVDSMPETGENVAAQFGIGRAGQDAFALRSQQRTAQAVERKFFLDEIAPISVPNGKAGSVIVARDEHPRPDSSLEGLARLKAVVREGGTVTAGNSSGINDGAAALIVASEEAVRRHNLTPRARILGFASAGVPPRIMGIGPVPSTQRLMARTGIKIADFDVVELNEAFAAQALAVLRQLGIPEDAPFVNANGGAIALGHPLGASGARLALTATRRLLDEGASLALVTMCVGVGQGASMAIGKV